MAHFHIKTKKGRPYLYVREIARVNGKPKVISQIYIGSPEKTAALAKGDFQEEKHLRVEEFGALWAALQMDSDIDLAGIIDSVITCSDKETGPSVGEYFLYCVLNRMVEAKSKNQLSEWYRNTAIQHIRPVEIDALNSQRYWEKWNRVDEKKLDIISKKFFEKIWALESPIADCLLFDTTNYYTFMASDTESELAMRGKNKEGRHHLRQVGLGLMVAKDSRLPLHYSVYPGNLHDSRQFKEIMDDMFGVVCGLNKTKDRLTIVIDKGMNSHENYSYIDEHSRMHFVTTYSTYFAEDLAITPIERFEVVDTEKNRRLALENKPTERLLAYRTTGEFWGKDRAVVVTHNPSTARKKNYNLDAKLDTLRQELILMREKVREQVPHWRSPEAINERYLRLCERLHISSDLYEIELSSSRGQLTMAFRKDAYRVERKRSAFGRNIIITDNIDWTTEEIVQSSLDRWQVEDRFRMSKDDDLIGTLPIRHWTDSKIRCHLFCCVVALTYLRRLELKLKRHGINRTAPSAIEDMNHLHSILSTNGSRKPRRYLERPSKTQAEVLTALGYRINGEGVLQSSNK